MHADEFATSGHHHDGTYVNVSGDVMTGDLEIQGKTTIIEPIDDSDAATKYYVDVATDVLLGEHSSPPTDRPDGGALQEGDRYYNTSSKLLYVWNGTEWDPLTGIPSEDGKRFHHMNTKGVLGDSYWSPFVSYPQLLTQNYTIESDQTATIGPFALEDGSEIIIEDGGVLIIL
jgi:hypothetical protein